MMRHTWIGRLSAFCVFAAHCPLPTAHCLADHAPLPKFERIVIDDDFPGAYQVEAADIDGDGKPDIVALGGGTVAWYQNPTWTKRIITGPDTTPGVISSASADLDRDGKAEVAIAYEFAMNEPKRGKLGLAIQGRTVDDPWTWTPIADVPSIHRLRWADFERDDKPELVVAPIFGPGAEPPAFQGDPARLVYYRTGDDPKSGKWTAVPVGTRPVMHAILARDAHHGSGGIVTADNLGVGEFVVPAGEARTLAPGAQGEAPKRGASEVHFGHLLGIGPPPDRPDGPKDRYFLVTIEPWHGSEVVVRIDQDPHLAKYGPRTVIDDTLDAGHALWTADIDGDGDDEIFAGHRGKDHRVSAYNFNGKTWDRTVLDPDIAAQDLRGGDLDGDGTPDVVAVGGSTHNVIWYRPIRP